MQGKLIINGTDFTPWIEEDGIAQEPIYRVRRSVVTLDGTELRTEIEKQLISVNLVKTITDDRAAELMTALRSSRPAVVTYTTKDGVTRSGISFYVSGPTGKEKRIVGGTTVWSGVSFTLEEK